MQPKIINTVLLLTKCCLDCEKGTVTHNRLQLHKIRIYKTSAGQNSLDMTDNPVQLTNLVRKTHRLLSPILSAKFWSWSGNLLCLMMPPSATDTSHREKCELGSVIPNSCSANITTSWAVVSLCTKRYLQVWSGLYTLSTCSG